LSLDKPKAGAALRAASGPGHGLANSVSSFTDNKWRVALIRLVTMLPLTALQLAVPPVAHNAFAITPPSIARVFPQPLDQRITARKNYMSYRVRNPAIPQKTIVRQIENVVGCNRLVEMIS
jgi:hypothetical protein